MVKKDYIYRILIYILMIFAIFLPWLTKAKYNQDLLVIIVYLNTNFEDMTLWDSFKDNTTFVYAIRVLFPDVSSYTLIFILHNISVVLLTFVLKRYLRPIYVCAVMLFCFFTIFCNQFRLAYALSVGIIGFMTYLKNRNKGILIMLFSAFFHFFAAFFLVSILLVDLFNRSKGVYKLLTIIIVSLTLLIMFYFVVANPRFLLYLEKDEGDFVSNTYLLVFMAMITIWKSVDENKKKFVCFICIMVIITAPLPNVSSRLGELLFIIMLFLSKDALLSIYSNRWVGCKLQSYRSKLYFFIGLFFFFYRFTNWIILGKIIRPDVLDFL